MLRSFCRSQIIPTKITVPQLQYVANKTSSIFLRSLSSSCRHPCEVTEMFHLPAKDRPWLMLNPEIGSGTGDVLERFYSPAENMLVKLDRKKCLKMSNSAHCVGSTIGGWLSYVDPNDCSVYLTTPYSSDEVVQLPSLTTLPSVVDVKRDPETGAIISVQMESGYNRGKSKDTDWHDPMWVAKHMVTNMAMSSSDPSSHDNVVVAIQGKERRLVYCPIGKEFQYRQLASGDNGSREDNLENSNVASSLEWLGLQEYYHPGESYNQAVYCSERKLFWTFFGKAGIQAFDLHSDRKRRSKMVLADDLNRRIDYAIFTADCDRELNAKVKGLDKISHGKHYYMVAFNSEDILLLVKHYRKNPAPHSDEDAPTDSSTSGFTPYETVHFDVYKIINRNDLKRVDSFGGESVFVGLNQSFVVSADEVPGLRPNCIYFSDDLHDKVYSNWGYDHGIFDLRDDCILPLGYEQPQVVPFSENYSQFWVSPA